MAELVLKDAYVELNGNVLSDHVTKVQINYQAALQETTAMGDSSVNRISGLKDFDVDLTLNQDYAAGNIDSILFPLVGVAASIFIKPTSATVGTSNPKYRGTVLLESFSPISGGIGDKAEVSPKFKGTGNLGRATA